MTQLSISLISSDGDRRVLTLRGRRATVALWIGQRLPLDVPWGRVLHVAIVFALGGVVVPNHPEYTDPDEADAYYKGYDHGFHDEPMVESDYPNAYTRGYWEGKR